MSGSTEQENQNACEMKKLSLQEEQQSPYNELLAQILRQMIAKSAKELKAAYRPEKKKKASGNVLSTKVLSSIQRPEDADVSPLMNQGNQLGRKIKNQVVAEKVVCFTLPENCDDENIKDIDKVQDRLGKWRIQRRQRDSKTSDTYYCHLSSRQTFRSIPEAVSFIMCQSQPKPSQKKNKGENMTSDESPLKKARKNEEKPEDFSSESVENRMDSNLEKSDYGLEGNAIEEMSLQFKPCNDLLNVISDANENETGKENSKEMQAQITTETVEALVMTTEVNEENPKMKEYSVEVGIILGEKGRSRDILQENFIQEFATLQEALEKVGNIELEDIDEVEDNTQPEKKVIMDMDADTINLIENSTEMQAQITTETVEALTMTTEANEENPKLKEYSGEVGTILGEKEISSDILQENFIQEFETLQEALEKVGNIELECIDEVKDNAQPQKQVVMDMDADTLNLIENYTEMQAHITTEAVETLPVTAEANEENPKLKEHYVEIATILGEKGRSSELLQENCGREFETLEEALENIGNIELEGIDEVEDNAEDDISQLQDITMDWASNDGILESFFDECDLANHIPTSKDVPDLVEFLINNRKK